MSSVSRAASRVCTTTGRPASRAMPICDANAASLGVVRGVLAVVVQAALADRDHGRVGGEVADPGLVGRRRSASAS